MQQTEVWWLNQPAPVGRRPVLLLSRNEAYKIRASVTVALITSTIRKIPAEVLLDESDGMPKLCVVNCDTILTIDKSRLQSRICILSQAKWLKVIEAIKFALNLP